MKGDFWDPTYTTNMSYAFSGIHKVWPKFWVKKVKYHDHHGLIRSSQLNFQRFWKNENLISCSLYIRVEESFWEIFDLYPKASRSKFFLIYLLIEMEPDEGRVRDAPSSIWPHNGLRANKINNHMSKLRVRRSDE